MSYTKDFEVGTADWTLLVTGQDAGFVQLKDGGPVLVQVAQAKPNAASVEGTRLVEDGLEEASFTGLEEGDNIYARSPQNETNTVCVIAAGSAPS